jgi:hypothetical protein
LIRIPGLPVCIKWSLAIMNPGDISRVAVN